MEQVFSILRENPIVSFATVDEQGNPQVRALKVKLIENGIIYFLTGSGKNVYKQILQHPQIAFNVTTKDHVSVRITGNAVLLDDKGILQRIFDEHEELPRLYKSVDNPVMKMFYIQEVAAEIFDLSKTPPQRTFFN